MPARPSAHHLLSHVDGFAASRTVDFRAEFLDGRNRTRTVGGPSSAIRCHQWSDVSLSQLWNIRCWWTVHISCSVVHAQHACATTVAVALRSELLSIARATKELVVVLRSVRAVQHLLAMRASEAKLMETFAECQFFLSKIDIFFAAGANSGHCCNESSARVCDRDSGKPQILKSEKSKFPL